MTKKGNRGQDEFTGNWDDVFKAAGQARARSQRKKEAIWQFHYGSSPAPAETEGEFRPLRVQWQVRGERSLARRKKDRNKPDFEVIAMGAVTIWARSKEAAKLTAFRKVLTRNSFDIEDDFVQLHFGVRQVREKVG